MAQYAVIIYERKSADGTTVDMPPEVIAAHEALGGRIVAAGGREVAGLALQPTSTATSIQGGVVTDGPFIEAKEYLGGITVIEVPDLDEALRWGTRSATSIGLPIEVRPFYWHQS